ncbi:uncharacterized protein OCT59_020154 [Rhizophagus irregularis]|uniref:Alpha-1,3-glucosyltransferase n=2 Tax=Rhizophagus irregularis TaxID=588596 RepID=A0A015IPB4_RHIIW|nr:dolichyl-P-Glc:Glc1Man(9)GlcNAc(2)-PP-dolichol alpha-1,3-glucosyltransferase [Rhizophagus irregularis DAOM 197198w]UZO01642.1 hypothetical protein OCT59_020154 [Rhizophagus irregularis]GBC25793.1 glycosyltransferase family 57 protein [Rhizophagus irregularis DAOM 181602=DAOM 197198]CAG8586681.1 19491_t:CDS:2 [Rhizophagus irregularis]
MRQLGQVLSRLFLFKRRFCHAYWAPNFWALYSAADLAKLLGWTLNESAIGSITSGLIEDVNSALLPQVKANHTFILILILQMISLVKSWEASKLQKFSRIINIKRIFFFSIRMTCSRKSNLISYG